MLHQVAVKSSAVSVLFRKPDSEVERGRCFIVEFITGLTSRPSEQISIKGQSCPVDSNGAHPARVYKPPLRSTNGRTRGSFIYVEVGVRRLAQSLWLGACHGIRIMLLLGSKRGGRGHDVCRSRALDFTPEGWPGCGSGHLEHPGNFFPIKSPAMLAEHNSTLMRWLATTGVSAKNSAGETRSAEVSSHASKRRRHELSWTKADDFESETSH